MNNPMAQREPRALCVFCAEGPGGSSGHPGIAQEIHRIGNSDRAYQRVVCEFCGAEWARHRQKAGMFEWLRLAD